MMQCFENVDLFENRIQSLQLIPKMFEMNIHNHLAESSSILIQFVPIMAGTIVAVIPNFHDIQFIRKHNLADDTETINKNGADPSTEQVKNSQRKSRFFVNTKFHFENNSWTWVHGGQIRQNEWLNIQDTNEIYPFIPIQV